MRLPLLPPDRLTPEQRALYNLMLKQNARGFSSFKTMTDEGAMLGPWSVLLHEPAVGQACFDQIDAVAALKRLPDAIKEVVLLTTGAHYRAAYEVYAHATLAKGAGLDAAKIATIAAGERPADLSLDEGCAYDMTRAMVAGGVVPDAVFLAARERFGQDGLNELVFWVGLYAQISLVLNAFDVPSEQAYH